MRLTRCVEDAKILRSCMQPSFGSPIRNNNAVKSKRDKVDLQRPPQGDPKAFLKSSPKSPRSEPKVQRLPTAILTFFHKSFLARMESMDSMEIHGYAWISMKSYSWIFKAIHLHLLTFMDINRLHFMKSISMVQMYECPCSCHCTWDALGFVGSKYEHKTYHNGLFAIDQSLPHSCLDKHYAHARFVRNHLYSTALPKTLYALRGG